MFSYSERAPETVFAILLSFIISVTIHEFMHAWTAWRLGDDTAAMLGRVSLNPAVHFEPFGLFGMVLIAFGFPAIGWGKPVPVNPYRLRPTLGQRKVSMGLIAFAGPLSNVVQAAVVSIPLRFDDAIRAGGNTPGTLGFYLTWFMWVNILLASFNMIPIPPLDGHKILMAILPNFWTPVLAPLERYGFIILLLLLFVGGSLGSSVVGGITGPIRDLLLDTLYYL